METNRPLCFHELNHKLLAAPRRPAPPRCVCVFTLTQRTCTSFSSFFFLNFFLLSSFCCSGCSVISFTYFTFFFLSSLLPYFIYMTSIPFHPSFFSLFGNFTIFVFSFTLFLRIYFFPSFTNLSPITGGSRISKTTVLLRQDIQTCDKSNACRHSL